MALANLIFVDQPAKFMTLLSISDKFFLQTYLTMKAVWFIGFIKPPS